MAVHYGFVLPRRLGCPGLFAGFTSVFLWCGSVVRGLVILRSVSPIVFCNMGGTGVRLVGTLCPGLHVITHNGIVGILNSRRRVYTFRRGVVGLRGCYTRCGSLGRRIVVSVVGKGTPRTRRAKGIVMFDMAKGPVVPHDRGRLGLMRKFTGGSVIFTVNPTKSKGACATVTLTIHTLGGGRVGGVVLDHPTMRTNRGLNFLPNSVGRGVSPCLRPLCSTLRSVVPTTGLGRCVRLGVVRVTPLTFVHKHALGSTIMVLSRTRGAAARRVGVFLAHVNVGAGVVIAKSVARVSLPVSRASNLMRTLHVLGKMGNVDFMRLGGGSVMHRGLMRHVMSTCRGFSGREGATGRKTEIAGRGARIVGGGPGTG